ncbi:hypothetical protein KCP78_14740 [Salmonella enterica subsp. enterica]|nr:hypothetical protein KCP78_14740 [Salmonella enterica subsp. enterica]
MPDARFRDRLLAKTRRKNCCATSAETGDTPPASNPQPFRRAMGLKRPAMASVKCCLTARQQEF